MTDVKEDPKAKLMAAVAILNRTNPLPSVLELQAVFKGFKQDITEDQAKGMIAYVKAELDIPKDQRILEQKQQQSLVTEKATDSSSEVHRNLATKDDLWAIPPETKEATNMQEMWTATVKKHGSRPYLGVRAVDQEGKLGAYEWETYAQADQQMRAFGAGLVGQVGLKKGDRLGINLKTQKKWTIAQGAVTMYGLVTATLYDTLGPQAIQYILDLTEVSTVLTDSAHLPQLSNAKEENKSLVNVIVVDTPSQEQSSAAKKAGLKVFLYADLLAYGEKNPVDPPTIKSSDPLLICFTSGTTGNPKGVQHSHGNILAGVAAGAALQLSPDDVHISFLPLAHIMEFFLQTVFTVSGSSMGFFAGNTLKLLDDVQALKPTVFIAVPRLLNKIFDKVTAGQSALPAPVQAVAKLATQSKLAALKDGRVRSFWDYIVFQKVRPVLGGRVRMIATGSAPIAPKVLNFYRTSFSCIVMEGYGMSEVLVTNFTLPNDINGIGTVGPPTPCTEIKLVSVPEMDYLVTDKPFPRGEICFRGPTIMQGYYKNKEKTDGALVDGWLHSGDVGTWTANGCLKIIDRVKNIFKLSQGEYVAPQRVENVVVRSPLIGGAFVHGNSLESCLVGVFVPDPDAVLPWAAEHKIEGDLAQLCKSEQLKAAMLEEAEKLVRGSGMKGFEVVRNVHLSPKPFAENGLLTPSFKLKRASAAKFFAKELETLYAEIKEKRQQKK